MDYRSKIGCRGIGAFIVVNIIINSIIDWQEICEGGIFCFIFLIINLLGGVIWFFLPEIDNYLGK